MTEPRCGSCGARGAGSDGVALSEVRFAARIRAATGRRGDLRRRTVERRLALSRLAAAGRSGGARGADDGARRGPGRGQDRPREARGRTPDRLVQGPRDQRDGLVAAGPGRARDRRRLVRERRGIVRRVCGASRAAPHVVRAGRRLAGQAAPGSGAWRRRRVRAGTPGGGRRGGETRARGRRPRGRLCLAPLAAGIPGRDRDLRLRGVRGARAAGRPMPSSLPWAAARCSSAPTSASAGCGRRA